MSPRSVTRRGPAPSAALALAFLLPACDLPDGDFENIGPLWQPAAVLPAADGAYVPLPEAQGLAFVAPDREARRVGFGEAAVRGAVLMPDSSGVSAFIDRYRCDTEGNRDLRNISEVRECPEDRLSVETSLAVVRGGDAEVEIALDAPYNRIGWAPDGRYGLVWLDASAPVAGSGVLNLTAVRVVGADGTSRSVPVGFAAQRALFTPDGSRAVVLSQGAVAVVDLAAAERSVSFALTLDPDQVVSPVDVSLTPDGRYALIPVQGFSDLYVLDLENPSVNLVSLAGSPASMQVDPAADRTVLVYEGTAAVDILEHRFFDVERVQLDEPMSDILEGPGFSLLYRPGSYDVYRLSIPDGDLVEFRLDAPLARVALAPDGRYAVALTGSPEGPGMEVLDLTDDRGRSYPYRLESGGVAAAFADAGGSVSALILQADVDYLYALDLGTGEPREIDLAAPPIGLLSRPGGGFLIPHNRALGGLTFLDASGEVEGEAWGFAALGLGDTLELQPARNEEGGAP